MSHSIDNEFLIAFSGLKRGTHLFEFDIDGAFFQDKPYALIRDCNIKVVLELLKKENMLELNFTMNGTMPLICDRCLEEFNYDMCFDKTIYVKTNAPKSAPSEKDIDLHLLSANEHSLDVSPFIYEFISISVPMVKYHPNDKQGNSLCNQEMINKIKPSSESANTLGDSNTWNELKKKIFV